MKLVTTILLIGLFLPASVCRGISVDNLTLMSEQFPPFNFEESGRLQGTSIDLMELILEKVSSKLTRKDITLLPWARGYNALLTENNTVLFVVTRTSEREHLFKWVGPISTARNVLIARKDRHISLKSVAEARKYKIGVVRQDAGEQLVVKAGIALETLDRTSEALANIRKLDKGRIDLFAYDEAVTHWLMQKNGINPNDFETVAVTKKGYHFFAFHKNTPDELIRKFQQALEQLKKEGACDKIMALYLK